MWAVAIKNSRIWPFFANLLKNFTASFPTNAFSLSFMKSCAVEFGDTTTDNKQTDAGENKTSSVALITSSHLHTEIIRCEVSLKTAGRLSTSLRSNVTCCFASLCDDFSLTPFAPTEPELLNHKPITVLELHLFVRSAWKNCGCCGFNIFLQT